MSTIAGQDWTGLDWTGLDCTGMDWTQSVWNYTMASTESGCLLMAGLLNDYGACLQQNIELHK